MINGPLSLGLNRDHSGRLVSPYPTQHVSCSAKSSSLSEVLRGRVGWFVVGFFFQCISPPPTRTLYDTELNKKRGEGRM